MAPKGNKTLKPDNTIVVDLKKRHNEAKAELLVIDDNIAAKYSELEAFLEAKANNQAQEEAQLRAELAALKEKKIFLTTLIPEDKQILGEDE